MKTIFAKIEKFLTGCERIICSAGMVMTIVVVMTNIVMDWFFHTRNAAFEELASFGYVWVTYASMGYLYRRNDLMEVTFVVDALPRIPKYFVEILRELIIIAFGAVMCYYGIKLSQGGLIKKLVATQIPYFYLDISIVVGFFSQSVSCLKDLIVNLSNIGNVFKGTYPPKADEAVKEV